MQSPDMPEERDQKPNFYEAWPGTPNSRVLCARMIMKRTCWDSMSFDTREFLRGWTKGICEISEILLCRCGCGRITSLAADPGVFPVLPPPRLLPPSCGLQASDFLFVLILLAPSRSSDIPWSLRIRRGREVALHDGRHRRHLNRKSCHFLTESGWSA